MLKVKKKKLALLSIKNEMITSSYVLKVDKDIQVETEKTKQLKKLSLSTYKFSLYRNHMLKVGWIKTIKIETLNQF